MKTYDDQINKELKDILDDTDKDFKELLKSRKDKKTNLNEVNKKLSSFFINSIRINLNMENGLFFLK